jgi:hypothetical protein
MTSFIGPQCANGDECWPGHPARPVWGANVNPDGYCWQCYASKRRVNAASQAVVRCDLCGDEIAGSCVTQPVFGAEPLRFHTSCATSLREARESAARRTQPVDAVLLDLEATFDAPAFGEAA